jgi:hypothetical protein
MFRWGGACRLILLANSIALAITLRTRRVVQRSIVQGSMCSNGSDPSGRSMFKVQRVQSVRAALLSFEEIIQPDGGLMFDPGTP